MHKYVRSALKCPPAGVAWASWRIHRRIVFGIYSRPLSAFFPASPSSSIFFALISSSLAFFLALSSFSSPTSSFYFILVSSSPPFFIVLALFTASTSSFSFALVFVLCPSSLPMHFFSPLSFLNLQVTTIGHSLPNRNALLTPIVYAPWQMRWAVGGSDLGWPRHVR